MINSCNVIDYICKQNEDNLTVAVLVANNCKVLKEGRIYWHIDDTGKFTYTRNYYVNNKIIIIQLVKFEIRFSLV